MNNFFSFSSLFAVKLNNKNASLSSSPAFFLLSAAAATDLEWERDENRYAITMQCTMLMVGKCKKRKTARVDDESVVCALGN